MPETKLRQWVRQHEVEIIGGLVGAGLATGYLLTVNLSAKAAAKQAIHTLRSQPVPVRVHMDPAIIAKDITAHMTVDEKAIAARILQGIMDVQRGAEVILDA